MARALVSERAPRAGQGRADLVGFHGATSICPPCGHIVRRVRRTRTRAPPRQSTPQIVHAGPPLSLQRTLGQKCCGSCEMTALECIPGRAGQGFATSVGSRSAHETFDSGSRGGSWALPRGSSPPSVHWRRGLPPTPRQLRPEALGARDSPVARRADIAIHPMSGLRAFSWGARVGSGGS